MKAYLTRRAFLRLGAAAPAAMLFPSPAGAGPLTHRTLGRTGLKVTEVAMGVMLTSDPAIVRAALDAGVNYFDTARAYMGGRNEEILARGLGEKRKEVIVATKCHRLGRRDRVIATVEESLRALGTDYIDVLQLHNLSSRREVLDEDNIEALDELRRQGKIRFAGVTTHSGMVEVMDAAVEAGVFDTVLTSFNFLSPAEVSDAVARTSGAGIGVVAMKTMAGGYRDGGMPGLSPFQAALRWVLRNAAVATSIPSMATFEQLRENVAVMGQTARWSDGLSLGLYAGTAGSRYCRACGACRDQCPASAEIPSALRALMYAEGYGRTDMARETISGLLLPCRGCGECTVLCRHGLDVPSLLAAAFAICHDGSAV